MTPSPTETETVRRLAISSDTFADALEEKRVFLPELFTEAARLGFDGLEISGAHFQSVNDLYLGELSLCRRRTGVELVALSLSNDFAYPLRAERDRQVTDVTVWMDIARRLQVNVLRILTGDVVGDRRQSEDWVRTCLSKVVPEAEARNIVLAIENRRTLFASVDELTGLLKEFDSPILKLVVNPTTLGNEKLKTFLPKAALVRIDIDESVLAASIEALSRSGYAGDVVLNTTGQDDPSKVLRQAARTCKTMENAKW